MVDGSQLCTQQCVSAISMSRQANKEFAFLGTSHHFLESANDRLSSAASQRRTRPAEWIALGAQLPKRRGAAWIGYPREEHRLSFLRKFEPMRED